MRNRTPKEWTRTAQAFVVLGIVIYAILVVLDALTEISSLRLSGLKGGAAGFAVAGTMMWLYGARKGR